MKKRTLTSIQVALLRALFPIVLVLSVSNAAMSVTPGDIITIAGNGTRAFSGDNGPATSASLNYPNGVAVDSAGNLYIADISNNRIRKVAAGTGVITTVAGNGTAAFSGDNGPATSAGIFGPAGVTVDSAGNLYIADMSNNRIRKVTAGTGIITTVAGNGSFIFSGDNGLATSASFSGPSDVRVDSAGNLYIADNSNYRIRKVTAGTGIITTVAGNGTAFFSGDNGPATSAGLGNNPNGVALDSAGNLYIADTANHRIRKVTAGTGIITTVAGNGTFGFSGDNGPATSASLNTPFNVSVDSAGNLYIADNGNNRIRMVAAGTGIITTVAGSATPGFSGDNGPPTSASLFSPKGVSVDSAGNLYIADSSNHRIRKVLAAALSPAATTGAASPISATGATLNGTVNDNGASTTVTFEYGPTTAYGISASGGAVYPGTGSTAVSAPVTPLTCGTSYHFRVDASNRVGMTSGIDQTFTTSACTYVIGVGVVGGNGNISCTTPVTQGGTSTCTISPSTGYHLATFTDNTVNQLSSVTANSYAISNVSAGHTIQGTFAINTYTLTVTKSGTGSGTVASTIPDTAINCGAICTASYNGGTTVTLTATSAPFSTFTAWAGCDTASGNQCTVAMTAARNVTASFVANTQAITGFTPQATATYGDAPIALSATGGASGNPVIFSVVSGPGSLSGNILTITGAGTITLKASQAGNSTYAAAPDVTASLVVAAKPLTITAGSASRAFGAANPAVSAFTAVGLVGGDTIASVTNTIQAAATLTAPLGSSYSITPSAAVFGAGNAASYSIGYLPGTLTIVGQAPQAITGFTPQATATYGDAPLALSATGGASGNPVIFSVVSGPGSLSGNILTITGAGTITLKASQAGDANYAAAADVIHAMTVNKAILTVTAVSTTRYIGASNPVFTAIYSGLTNNDKVSDITGTPSLTTAATTVSPIGSYDITVSLGTLASPNYDFKFVNGMLNVSEMVAGPDGKTIAPIDLKGSPGSQLTIAAGTLLTDAAGQPVSGALTMTSTPMNSISALSPAASTGHASDGTSLAALAASVDMVLSAGGATVKTITPPMLVSLPLSSAFAAPGASVQYYSFDGTTWRPEGSAVVKADGTVDINVGHLSIWAVAQFKKLPSGKIALNGTTTAVTVADALRALQIAVGMIQPSANDLAEGDVAPLVNGRPSPNNQINVGDAIVILQEALGVVKW